MRRRGGLEFPHTCPTIDKALNEIEFEVDRTVNSILSEDYENAKTDLHIDLCHSVMDAICGAVERVRTSNQDIREAAEKQITELSDELSEAIITIDDSNKYIETLEREVADLKYEAADYQMRIEELEKENNKLADKLYEYEQ